jgi:hypothetical protein
LIDFDLPLKNVKVIMTLTFFLYMRYCLIVLSVLMLSSCFSRWGRNKPAANPPKNVDIVIQSDFTKIDTDKDGVISKTEYIEKKEELLEEKDSGYLWAFLGIVFAVVAACCVPFVYMFTTKHVKLQWDKSAAARKKNNESSTEV